MSTDTHSQKANVASDRAHENPIASEQSNAQTTPETKDTETLFREAWEEAEKMTCEERWERHPCLRDWKAVPVTVDKGMQILEEMERLEREEAEREEAEREEAAKPDRTETTSTDSASQ